MSREAKKTSKSDPDRDIQRQFGRGQHSLPFGPVNDPSSYALRVRSFRGRGNDTRQFSEWSATGNIEMFL